MRGDATSNRARSEKIGRALRPAAQSLLATGRDDAIASPQGEETRRKPHPEEGAPLLSGACLEGYGARKRLFKHPANPEIAALSEERRERIKARTAELIAEEMTLRDQRKAMAKTQVEIAKALDIGQEGVSRLEKRTDMLLSTLDGYVRAMGGELNVVATFPDRAPVVIEALADVSGESGTVDAVDAAE